jgi:DNA-binding winged helix-turn-helix (wHTH) protein/TolB-like protein/Tfp pilus assembly protein PilF
MSAVLSGPLRAGAIVPHRAPVLQNAFRIGDSHQVEPSLNSVTGPAGTIRLEPKVMQVLVLLAAHAGQVVAKERLMQTVWPDAFVTDDVLTRAISELRRVFGDDPKESRFIQTIPKSGYRVIARVSPTGADQEIPAPRQPVHLEVAAAADDRVIASLSKTRQTSAHDQTRRRSSKIGLWAISLAAVIVVGVVVLNRLRADMEVPRVTIAVLPFEHLGGPEREYLTDGLTEETSASLGQIDPEHLSVKGRTSTRRYKRTSKSPAEIGQELGVEYLVEGSVQAESRRLRVTSKLIRVRDQVQMWAQSYESEPGSMLELQRELSAAIAGQVRLRLSPQRLTALATRHTQNAEAYDLYLRGRHFWNQLTPETNQRAVASYQKATQLDPEFALAWAGLADIYSASPINSDVAPIEVAPRAQDAIARAVASGSGLAETQTALGTVHYWLDWDWPAAETAFRKAISVDPSYSQAYRVLGIVLVVMGRREEGREAMRRARELDPYYPMQPAVSASERALARDYSSALEFAKQATAVGPSFWIAHLRLAEIYERLGNSEQALEALEKAQALSGNSKMLSLRGYILAKSGRTNEAEEVLRTLKSIARERYVPPYAMALVYAGLGQRESLFEWLDRAYAARDVHLIFLLGDPKWDDFREDPRFRRIVERCDFMRTAKTGGHTQR